jgi:hypothetical protein
MQCHKQGALMTALIDRQDTVLAAMQPPQFEVQPIRERRKRLRIAGPYAARVRWAEAATGAVKRDAILENLSSSGLYMRITHGLEAGQSILVAFQMDPIGRPAKGRAARVAVRGSVLRMELLDDGLWGVVVVFKQYRFL